MTKHVSQLESSIQFYCDFSLRKKKDFEFIYSEYLFRPNLLTTAYMFGIEKCSVYTG